MDAPEGCENNLLQIRNEKTTEGVSTNGRNLFITQSSSALRSVATVISAPCYPSGIVARRKGLFSMITKLYSREVLKRQIARLVETLFDYAFSATYPDHSWHLTDPTCSYELKQIWTVAKPAAFDDVSITALHR